METEDFHDLVAELPLEAGLTWHLKDHLEQEHPDAMIPVARRAVESAARGEMAAEIDLPDGVEHVKHGGRVPASEVVRGLRLDPWVWKRRVELAGDVVETVADESGRSGDELERAAVDRLLEATALDRETTERVVRAYLGKRS